METGKANIVKFSQVSPILDPSPLKLRDNTAIGTLRNRPRVRTVVLPQPKYRNLVRQAIILAGLTIPTVRHLRTRIEGLG